MTVNKHNTQEVVSELDNVILSQKKDSVTCLISVKS